jgi:hypothetical protein
LTIAFLSTFPTAVVDKPAEEEDHGHGHAL